MRRIEELQTFKPKPVISYRPRIVDQSIDNRSTNSLSTICGWDVHPLDFSHARFQSLQAAHACNLIFILSKVETSVGRMKFIGIGKIRLHHCLDIKLDAVLAPESIV